MTHGRPAGWLVSKAPVGRADLGAWRGSFLLTLPKSRAIGHRCACLPLGLRKWREGHLGTAGGLEIPRGSIAPEASPNPSCPGFLLQRGKVRSLATVRQVERPPWSQPLPSKPLALRRLQHLCGNLEVAPGGWHRLTGLFPQAWPSRTTRWLLSGLSYPPDLPSATPWALGYQAHVQA